MIYAPGKIGTPKGPNSTGTPPDIVGTSGPGRIQLLPARSVIPAVVLSATVVLFIVIVVGAVVVLLVGVLPPMVVVVGPCVVKALQNVNSGASQIELENTGRLSTTAGAGSPNGELCPRV